MFHCGVCTRLTSPGEKAFRIVVQSRSVTYPYIQDAHRFRADGKKEIRDDPGGRGTQIVREVVACSSCYGDSNAT